MEERRAGHASVGEEAREEVVHEEVVEEIEHWRPRGQCWLKSSGSGGCCIQVNIERQKNMVEATHEEVIRISVHRKLHGGDVKTWSASADVRETEGAQGRESRAGCRSGRRRERRDSHL